MKFRFHKKYFLYFVLLLLTEIGIALWIENPTIRGNIGDVLVVILLYCLVQSFFELDKKLTIYGVGIFAVLVEIAQAFNLVEILGLQDYALARTVLGTTFDFNDIWSYLIGCVIIYFLEFYDEGGKMRKKKFMGF